MGLESFILDSNIDSKFEKKGLYTDDRDLYGLSNCEPIDENIQDTIDKLHYLGTDCKFGTVVELFDLKQLFELSEDVKKIIELADEKLKQLQKTNPSKAQKLQQLLEQAHTSDNALSNAIIQKIDREEISKTNTKRSTQTEPSYDDLAYNNVSQELDNYFSKKLAEIQQIDNAQKTLRDAEGNLNILTQFAKNPDSIPSAALESFIKIYQAQISKYQSVFGVDSKDFDNQSLLEQKSRIETKIKELQQKINHEKDQPNVAQRIETDVKEKERIQAEIKAKEEAEAKAKAEEKARIQAEIEAKEEARIRAEKKQQDLQKAKARSKAENESKIEQANNKYKHDIAENKATEEKQSLNPKELETIKQVEQSLRDTFGDGFDITRLRIESEQDFKNELSQKFRLQGLQDTSEIQKRLQDMIYEGNILGADIRTPQGLRRYQLFKQVIPNFEELKSKVLQIRGYDIALEDKLFEGIDLSNLSYDSILKQANSIIKEQVKLEEQARDTEMIRPQEESIRDEVGDEFAPKTKEQQQANNDAEIKWMHRMGSVAQEVDKTNAGIKGKQEVVKLIQDLQAREGKEQRKEEEQEQQSH